MLNRRVTISCIILTLLAAALQSAPGILGDTFSFVVILSGLPVYIAARFNWAYGTAVYLAAAGILVSMNTYEALFFICTNGFIGLSLGILKYHFKRNYTVSAISALITGVILFIINYFFEISIFGYLTFKTPVTQALALFPLLYIYCFIYLEIAIYANNVLRQNIEFNIY